MDEEIIQEIRFYQSWYILLAVSILLTIWSIAKGRMDKSAKDVFIGDESWKNKTPSQNNNYKKDENGWVKPYIKKWYHPKWWTPKFEEKFPFSSTAGVFVTDYWHFMQFIMLTSVTVAIGLLTGENIYGILITVVALKIIYGIWFNFGYEFNGFKIKIFRK